MDLGQSFHQRLTRSPELGEIRDGAIRYLMMRPDVLMGMFARLPLGARAGAMEALAASVTENGGKSVKAYRDSGAADPAAMMETIAATSADLGWGLWSFGPRDRDGLEVTVVNSPFAAGYGPSETPVCAPIRGMLGAIGPLLIGTETVTVTETSCHAVTGDGACRFSVTR